jgi:hypothetical protein
MVAVATQLKNRNGVPHYALSEKSDSEYGSDAE